MFPVQVSTEGLSWVPPVFCSQIFMFLYSSSPSLLTDSAFVLGHLIYSLLSLCQHRPPSATPRGIPGALLLKVQSRHGHCQQGPQQPCGKRSSQPRPRPPGWEPAFQLPPGVLRRGKWRSAPLDFVTQDRASLVASDCKVDSLTTASSQTPLPYHMRTQTPTFYL